jgi:hypothetical protein
MLCMTIGGRRHMVAAQVILMLIMDNAAGDYVGIIVIEIVIFKINPNS